MTLVNRVMGNKWTWFLALIATGIYCLYVFAVPEATKANAGAQRGSQSVSAGQEPDVIAQQRGVNARDAVSPESDVNVPEAGSAPAEDEQGWDCYSMGNGVCGADPAPKYQYEDGSETYARPEHSKATVTGTDVYQRGDDGQVTGMLDQGFTFNAVCETSEGYVQGSMGNYVSGQYVDVGPLPTC